jgi:hypothetical protein
VFTGTSAGLAGGGEERGINEILKQRNGCRLFGPGDQDDSNNDGATFAVGFMQNGTSG